jgi:hypothetical protein
MPRRLCICDASTFAANRTLLAYWAGHGVPRAARTARPVTADRGVGAEQDRVPQATVLIMSVFTANWLFRARRAVPDREDGSRRTPWLSHPRAPMPVVVTVTGLAGLPGRSRTAADVASVTDVTSWADSGCRIRVHHMRACGTRQKKLLRDAAGRARRTRAGTTRP